MLKERLFHLQGFKPLSHTLLFSFILRFFSYKLVSQCHTQCWFGFSVFVPIIQSSHTYPHFPQFPAFSNHYSIFRLSFVALHIRDDMQSLPTPDLFHWTQFPQFLLFEANNRIHSSLCLNTIPFCICPIYFIHLSTGTWIDIRHWLLWIATINLRIQISLQHPVCSLLFSSIIFPFAFVYIKLWVTI